MTKKIGKTASVDRALPNSLEAEQSCIGAILISPQEAGQRIRDELTADHFYYAAHQAIFREAVAMINGLQALDMITLTQRLQDKGQLEDIGGPVYLSDCVTRVPTLTNVEHYISIVVEKFTRRRFIEFGHNVIEQSFAEGNLTLEELQTELSRNFASVNSGKVSVTDMRTATKLAMVEIEQVLTSDRHITGFTTGFQKLDEYTLGMNTPDLWIIAGRPSDGKTALSCEIAAAAASVDKVPVGFISLEQRASALAKRTLASWSQVNMRRLRSMSAEDQTRLVNQASVLMNLPIYFDDRPALTASQISSTMRSMRRKYGCRVFVLDYLQLSRADERSFSRTDDIAKITAAIKGTSKELDAVSIVLSQLNRGGDPSKGRPTLTSLRDSGAIEQDADVVIFINHDLKREELEKWHAPQSLIDLPASKLERIVQLDIAKQREGERDLAAYVRFEPEFTRFSNIEADKVDPELFEGEKKG